MLADSFLVLTGVAADAAVLLAALVSLGVTYIAWRLGRRWILAITADDHYDFDISEYNPQLYDPEYLGDENDF